MSIGLNAFISGCRSQLVLASRRSCSLPYVSRRFRSEITRHTKKKPQFRRNHTPVPKPRLNLSLDDPKGIIAYFKDQVERWSTTKQLHDRLKSFGVPEDHISPLLVSFVSDVQAGKLSSPEAYDHYTLDRFPRSTSEDLPQTYADIVYTGIFYAWVSEPANQVALQKLVPESTLKSMERLFQAASCEHPAHRFVEARRSRRKIIMHVGPTNSGKTHHALRALAAAESGVYAGPLRLLAHEIWERLNLGQIVPAGVEVDPVAEPPPTIDTAFDIDPEAAATPAVRSDGNPKYARVCNMITGEEHKVVHEEAALTSCTVEMLSMAKKYEVAVVDEIQMIADTDRGYAWTNAVLGLNAKEVHLCGEETAVPIIEALLSDTNDVLEVKRYQRLTPLSVSESVQRKYQKVQKGDCIVTFSRRSIFATKALVEKFTGMKCAVVYGKLPAEVRSEQAALFNDPNSGYDVIVGSDAIGMGLNLKIRRIIFESLSKFDGESVRPLAVSQVKQIAGRAGRYGMIQEKGGFATTLDQNELPFLEESLKQPFSPLPAAILGPDRHTCHEILPTLPPNAGMKTLYDAHVYVAKLKPFYRYTSPTTMELKGGLIDNWADSLSLEDRIQFLMAPAPWRDESCRDFLTSLLEKYSNNLFVSLQSLLEGTEFLNMLLSTEERMAPSAIPQSDSRSLEHLETLHKLLGLYNWLAFRNPVAFPDTALVEDLKPRTERALHWALQAVTKGSKKPIPATAHKAPLAAKARIPFMSLEDLRKRKKAEELLRKEARKVARPVTA